MPRVVLLLAAFLILAVCRLSLASSCQNGPAQLIEFVGEGKGCTDESTLCKNFLECVGLVCEDIQQEGDNCTSIGTPCITEQNCIGLNCFLICGHNGTCEVQNRDVGDKCTANYQCMSGNCTGGVCIGTKQAGEACRVADNDCARGLYCLANRVNSTVSWSCQEPMQELDDCSVTYTNYNWSEAPFEKICAPGLACVYNSTDRSTMACRRLFAADVNETCYVPGPGMFCKYNLTCAPNGTTGQHICTAYPSKKPDNCTRMPGSLPPECPFGQACNCLTNSTGGVCVPFVGGGDSCEPYLEDFISCIKKHQCAFVPFMFPYHIDVLGSTQGALEGWFAAPAFDPLCAMDKCGVNHRRFVCCQNKGFPEEANSTAPDPYAYTPARVPQGEYCDLPKGQPEWVVPVIVLSGIVAVVLVIVLIYVIINRPDANHDAYEPINK